MPAFTISRLFVLIAVIIFVLVAFGVSFAGIGMVALGLAVWAASQLVP